MRGISLWNHGFSSFEQERFEELATVKNAGKESDDLKRGDQCKPLSDGHVEVVASLPAFAESFAFPCASRDIA